MPNHLTNLLPASRVRGIRRQYFLRLATVGLLMLAVLIVAQMVLIMPSYLYARIHAAQGKALLSLMDAEADTAEEQAVDARTRDLSRSGAQLAQLAGVPTASAALRNVLAVPHPGVTLSGFTFTAPQGEQAARLGITGTADARGTLRQYVAALSALPFVTSADLPISAYAPESDIPFTVTLSGTLMP